MRDGGKPAPSAADVRAVGIPAVEADGIASFLAQAHDPVPLTYADQERPIEDAHCHLQVISRAALLLYLATGASRMLLSEAGYSRDDLAFWWRRFGEARGLWDGETVPDNAFDNWADIETTVQASAQYRNNGEPHNLFDLLRREPTVVSGLAAWEAVGIWGLMT